MKNAIVIFAALVLAGCASNSYVKTHSEEALPPSKIVMVKPASYVIVTAVDGKEVNLDPSGGFIATDYEIEFLPGRHTLRLKFENGHVRSIKELDFPVNLEANRRYIIKPELYGGSWNPVLIDLTDKKECWTRKIGTWFEPQGCDANALGMHIVKR